MNRHAKAASLVLAAVAAALMTGCSASTTGPSDKAKDPRTEPMAQESSTVDKANWPPATPRSGLAKGLSLPLEDYMQTYQDTVTLDNAARHLQKTCMADYGLSITLPPAGSTPPPNDNDANIERRYGITDRATAEKYGYGLPDALQHQQGATLPRMSLAETDVFSGHTSLDLHDPNRASAPSAYRGKKIHKNGCAGWADDELGTRSLDFSLVSELDGQSLTQSQQTPAVQDAIKAWSTCMSSKGYTVDTPYNADKIVTHTDGTPSRDEIDVALADIDCKKSTDLVKIWFDADSAIQKQQIAAHRDALTTAKARNTAALAAAKTALTS